MNIFFYIRKCCCLVLLTMPLFSYAQKSIEQKVDSMKQAFNKRMDSIRRESEPKDTVKNELIRSPVSLIYNNVNTEKSVVRGLQRVLLQMTRFRHSHYLGLIIKAGLAKPVSVNAQDKLYLMLADNTSIVLNSSAKAISKGSERRNSSELRLAYDLTDNDFLVLLGKKVASIKITYVGGEWTVNMDNDSSENIKKACKLTQ